MKDAWECGVDACDFDMGEVRAPHQSKCSHEGHSHRTSPPLAVFPKRKRSIIVNRESTTHYGFQFIVLYEMLSAETGSRFYICLFAWFLQATLVFISLAIYRISSVYMAPCLSFFFNFLIYSFIYFSQIVCVFLVLNSWCSSAAKEFEFLRHQLADAKNTVTFEMILVYQINLHHFTWLEFKQCSCGCECIGS